MRRGARLVVMLAIATAIVLALVACAPGDPSISPGYVSGDGTVTVLSDADVRQVDLAGQSFDGEYVDVADFRGQVVIINTWYASCPPCRAEAADLVAADARDDVQVIGINSRDDAETALAFERTFEVEYPSIDDANGAAVATLQGLISISAVPTTLILDREGMVYARVIGQVEPGTLATLIDDAWNRTESDGGGDPNA